MDNEKFVTKFMEAHTKHRGLQGLSKEMGMTAKACSDKAYSLRKRGVKLPYLTPPMTEVSVLNAIVAKYGK